MSNGDNVRQAYDCIRVYRTALETWRVPFGLDLGFGVISPLRWWSPISIAGRLGFRQALGRRELAFLDRFGGRGAARACRV